MVFSTWSGGAGIAQSVQRRATVWRVWRSNFGGGWDFPHPSRPALRPTHPPIRWLQGLFPGRVKRPGRGVVHLSSSSAEVKEIVELYLYYLIWAFMVCSRVKFDFLLYRSIRTTSRDCLATWFETAWTAERLCASCERHFFYSFTFIKKPSHSYSSLVEFSLSSSSGDGLSASLQCLYFLTAPG
jgi:hypothetical protein